MFIIDQQNYTPQLDPLLGGKAKNLFYLRSNGIPIPDFICVNKDAYIEALGPIHAQIRELLESCDYGDQDQLRKKSALIKNLILGREVPLSLKHEWEDSKALFEDTKTFSVRSSALNEDGSKNSFAGQLSTMLNVERNEVLDNVRKCWASIFDPSALAYMHNKKIDPLKNGVSVIVQKLITSKSSGVMFQADPKGSTNKLLITAGYGLGEGIVSDQVESDLYTYDKIREEWKFNIEEKTVQVDCNVPGGGVKIEPVSEALRNNEVLTSEQRLLLLEESEKIASLYSHYQDIEWAFDHSGKLFILQSRPITTIPEGNKRTFDNSNIAESYPDVVLPLTFSVFRKDYRASIRGAFSLLGIPNYILLRHEFYFKYLIGYIQGRSYYNLGNWYRLLLLSPFFKAEIRKSFEKMIGTEGSFDQDLEKVHISRFENWLIAIRFIYFFIVNLFTLNRKIRSYFKLTQKIKDDFNNIELEERSSDELIDHLAHFTDRVVNSLSVPVLNDFYSMIFVEATSDQFNKKGLNDSSNLLNSLLANQQIASIEPLNSMNRIVEHVQQDSALQDCIKKIHKDERNNNWSIFHSILREKGFDKASSMIQRHIENYGYRALKELVLEEDTFTTDPFRMIDVLLNSIGSGPKNASLSKEGERRFEEQVKKIDKKWLLRWLLKKTRQTVANREATRMDRGKMFDILRSISHEIGERLVAEKVLNNKRDIFYLTVDELNDFRNGCSPDNTLSNLVESRKKEVSTWRTKDPNGILFTSGTVYSNFIEQQETNLSRGRSILKGQGCSPGIVAANAQVVHDPFQAKASHGKILVAPTTDPGWVFLMTTSSGLISERGSVLSHTAIIGRELGIPTIVGVRGASKIIENGSLLEINGDSGEIKLKAEQIGTTN